MTPGAECVGENETLEATARKMKDLDVGALPICREHGRSMGVVTDRDLVGMVSQADIARSMPEDRVGELVELISFDKY